MFRIDKPSAAAVLPTPNLTGTPGYFTDGNPTTGAEATIISADWLNAVQEELANAVTESGIALDKTERTQLYKAISGTKSTNITSAATINLGITQGDFVDITGTTTITSLGLAPHAGIMKTVRFTGTLTLTYNASSLLLPGKANITTAANDVAVFRALDTSGNWICLNYTKSNGENFSTAPFIDTNPIIVGSSDATKKLRFEVDGLTTNITRTITMRDSDLNLNTCAFLVNISTNQNINSAAYTKIQLNTKLFDRNNYFDSVTNYRYLPLIPGDYVFYAQTQVQGLQIGNIGQVFIYKNGTNISAGQTMSSANEAGMYTSTSTITNMNGTSDYIEAYVYQNDSVVNPINSATFATFLYGYKLP